MLKFTSKGKLPKKDNIQILAEDSQDSFQQVATPLNLRLSGIQELYG